MPSVLDVAKYFLGKRGPMSTWKLQKLCYYAQAWTLAWDEAELFPEEFQAWVDGPVCDELFQKHKKMYTISYDSFPYGDPNVFTDRQRGNLEIILLEYGDKDPDWLKEQTHKEAPWKNAREDMPRNQRGNAVISKEFIGEYYDSLWDEEYAREAEQELEEIRAGRSKLTPIEDVMREYGMEIRNI
jgi:uncharacterized phage-associated protein